VSAASPALRDLAALHGFAVVGVSTAELLAEALVSLERWWAAGHGADLAWMGRNPPERADPRTLLPAVRSVVSVVVEHGPPLPFAAEGRYGRVARYAAGRDYHAVLLPRLRALGRDLARACGARRSVALVDHSPFLERAAAARAGLGFFGKNTCLLRAGGGSYFLLGEVLLDAEVPTGPPEVRPADARCGTCRRCLDLCPTGAFPSPFVLDARRCVSYLTIESRGPIPRELRSGVGPWVFGCDACQEACPFNRFAGPSAWPELGPEAGVGARLDLVATLSLGDDAAFSRRFAGTPLLRPGRAGLVRNAAVVARNVGAEAAVPALRTRAREGAQGLVRGHALHALAALAPAVARPLAERARARDPDPFARAEAEAVLAGDPAP